MRQGGDGKTALSDGTAVDLELYKFDSCPFCHVVYERIDRLGVNVRMRDTIYDGEAARTLGRLMAPHEKEKVFVDQK